MTDDGTVHDAAGGPRLRELLHDAHERFGAVGDGEVSSVYPALASVPPELFGIAAVDDRAGVVEVGDSRHDFAIMSCAKPFVFALACEAVGLDEVRRRVGVDATGLPFDSLEAVRRSPGGRTNPMVNPGAIATTSLIPGGTIEVRWGVLLDGLSRFAGRPLHVDEDTYRSASATNHRNRELAALLHERGALATDPAEATDVYTHQSCLEVTAVDLAVMGATLAGGGVNPLTGLRVVSAPVARAVTVVMAVAGLYESTGSWLLDVGLPGKSGIGGGIVTVSPGRGGLGTFAPPLDAAGNSVRGSLVAAHLAHRLGLDVFDARPDHGAAAPRA